MLRPRTGDGSLHLLAGGALSAVALLAIFAYETLLQYGGTYPSAMLYLAGYILLPFGAIFSFRGAQLLGNRFAFIVPSLDVAFLAFAVFQFEWCLHFCAMP